MFIAALFMIAPNWKKPGNPWKGEWIKNLWCMHTLEYPSAQKRNTILTDAAAWTMSRESCGVERVNAKRLHTAVISLQDILENYRGGRWVIKR